MVLARDSPAKNKTKDIQYDANKECTRIGQGGIREQFRVPLRVLGSAKGC